MREGERDRVMRKKKCERVKRESRREERKKGSFNVSRTMQIP